MSNNPQMRTRRHLLSATLAAGLAFTGCGGDEPPRTAPPAPQAGPKAAAIPAGSVPIGCIGKWTTGTTGALTCLAGGPDKDRVKFDKTNFKLDKICVSDKRITSFTTGGTAVTFDPKPEGTLHCATFNATPQLPESCSCVAPAGGDCNPPPDGFACLATGHVAVQ